MSAQELLDHLGSGLTTVCRCWMVRRRDGTVYGFTDHDRDVAFDGITFRADTGMSAAALMQGTGLSVDNTEALGALSDTAIREANLGLTPVVDGQLLRIPLPELNAERRQELVKVAHKYAEQARIAVRQVRRDGMDTLKAAEKDGQIGQDEQHGLSDKVQKATDKTIEEIDRILSTKEAEILQV